jgi:hypothetical protein
LQRQDELCSLRTLTVKTFEVRVVSFDSLFVASAVFGTDHSLIRLLRTPSFPHEPGKFSELLPIFCKGPKASRRKIGFWPFVSWNGFDVPRFRRFLEGRRRNSNVVSKFSLERCRSGGIKEVSFV